MSLAFPKPSSRDRNKALLGRFAAVRTHCQVCKASLGVRLHIHHMTDLEGEGIHRRSDVFVNLMRLCETCHLVRFHSQAEWTKRQLRELKDIDECDFAEHYAELELAYDGDVLWAVIP